MKVIWAASLLAISLTKLQTSDQVGAQSSSVAPQLRYAAVAIGQYVPVVSTICPVDEPIDCVTPSTSSGPIAGISINAAAAGAPVQVAMRDSAICVFDNQPVVNDTATIVAGFCHDSSSTRQLISSAIGVTGKVLALKNADGSAISCPATYCAYVNVIYPGATGSLMSPSTADQSAWVSFIQSNQLTSSGPTGSTGSQGATGGQGIQGVAGNAGIQGATGAAGAAGSVGPVGATGVAGAVGSSGAAGLTGATGSTGAAGVLYYNASGSVTGKKCWQGTTTSTTSGTFTQSISTAGLTSVQYVNVAVIVTSGTAAGTYNAYTLSSSTASTINGIVTTPTTVSVLGALAVQLASAAQTIYVQACGT